MKNNCNNKDILTIFFLQDKQDFIFLTYGRFITTKEGGPILYQSAYRLEKDLNLTSRFENVWRLEKPLKMMKFFKEPGKKACI